MSLIRLRSRPGRLLFAFAVIWLAGTSLWLWEYKYDELFEKRTYIYDPWVVLALNTDLAVKVDDQDAVIEITDSNAALFDQGMSSRFRANGFESCYQHLSCPSTKAIDLIIPLKCDPEVFGIADPTMPGMTSNRLDCYFPILKNGKIVPGLYVSGTEAAHVSDAMLHIAEAQRSESIRSQIERWAPLHLAWLFGPIIGLFLVLRIGRWVLAAPEATTNA